MPRELDHIDEKNGVNGSISGKQAVVLVPDVSDVQSPEKVIPTLMWFDRLNDVHRLFTPALYRSSAGIFNFLGPVKERKSTALTPGARWHGSAPQDVEACAEVVNDITGDSSQSEGGLSRIRTRMFNAPVFGSSSGNGT